MSAYRDILALFGGFNSEDELLQFCGAHHVPASSQAQWDFDLARRQALMARAWNGEAITRWQVVGHEATQCAKLHTAKQSVFGFMPRVDDELKAGDLLRAGVIEKMRGPRSQGSPGSKPQEPQAGDRAPGIPTHHPEPPKAAEPILEAKKEPEATLPPAWDDDAPF